MYRFSILTIHSFPEESSHREAVLCKFGSQSPKFTRATTVPIGKRRRACAEFEDLIFNFRNPGLEKSQKVRYFKV